jgi:hypothetical protein
VRANGGQAWAYFAWDKKGDNNKRANLAKPRAAGGAVFLYIIAMHSRLAVLVHAQRIPLKTEWRRRLRIEPTSTPLANPDTLVYLMDETLTQLEALVRDRPAQRWTRLRKTHLEPLRSLCPCGLNPLLAYFSSGVEALDAILSTDGYLTKEEKSMLCQAWHFLAQSEIEALCEGCCRVCAPALSFSLVGKK